MTRRKAIYSCSHVTGVLVGIVLVVLGCATSATAQVASGNIVGTVRDASGAVIVDSSVTVRNTETGITRQVTTNNEGGYVVTLLQPGTTRLRWSGKGSRRLCSRLSSSM